MKYIYSSLLRLKPVTNIRISENLCYLLMIIIKHIFKSKSKLSVLHDFDKLCFVYKIVSKNWINSTNGQNLANSRQKLNLSTFTDNIVKPNIRF